MKRSILIGLVFGTLTLSACDQIRVPGDGRPNPTPPVTDPEPTAPEPTAPEPVTPEPVTPEPETTTPTTPDPAPTPAPTEDPTPETAEATPITDLAQVNAAVCGLALRPVDDSLTLAEVANATPPNPDTVSAAVINGDSASLSDFPGLVKMEPRETLPGGAISSGHCGATRIANNWFITAAHCLDDDYDEVLLIAGSENLQNPFAKRVQATASLCHAAYGGAGNNYVNDIALVRVDDAVASELNDLPIAAYGETQSTLVPFNYETVEMAGWGLTAFRGSLSNDLLTATLSLTGTGPAAIGVESIAGAGPCIGDSGGPLFVTESDGTKTVVGVLSVVEQNLETGQFCSGQYGARYTNLQGYTSWISETIAACESNNGLCGF